jgi:hypothetical protein
MVLVLTIGSNGNQIRAFMRSKFEFSHKPANVKFDRCKVCDLQE